MPPLISPTTRQAAGTLQPAKRFDQAPTGEPAIGERLTARWKEHGYKGAFIAATVTAVNLAQETCAVNFDDGSGDVDDAVPFLHLRRHNGVTVAESMPKKRAQSNKVAVRKTRRPAKALSSKGHRWWHNGIERSYFRAQEAEHETSAHRWLFDINTSYFINRKWVESQEPEVISLHDMLHHADKEDVSMHVNALSDFCKLLYLSTPSAAGMHDLLEKTGVDPIGPLSANDSAAREEIFAAHEFMAEAGNELEYEEGSGSGEN